MTLRGTSGYLSLGYLLFFNANIKKKKKVLTKGTKENQTGIPWKLKNNNLNLRTDNIGNWFLLYTCKP